MTPADLDRAAFLAWIEKEQERTQAEAEEATRAHLEALFGDNPDEAAGRRMAQLLCRYSVLAEVAGRIRSGAFDRRRPE